MRQFWADLWLLIQLRWTITFNTFRAAPLWQQLLKGLLFLWVAGWLAFVSALIGVGSGWLVRQGNVPQLEGLLPGLLLTIVALIILLSSFAVALGALFLTNDMEALMTAPVNRRALFTAKILDGLTTYYGIGLMTAIPALIAYGIGLRYGPFYYLLMLPVILATPLLPAGIGALLTMLVARLAPANRVREFLGFFGALFGISCSIIGQSSRLWINSVIGGFNGNQDPQVLIASANKLALLPLPSLVAGRGLAEAGHGQWWLALVLVAGFLALTIVSFGGCVLVADRLYATGWARMQSAGVAKRSEKQAAHDAANAGLLGRAPAWAAIMLKDWRVIPRDLRNFAQLLTPLIILPIAYFNLIARNGNSRSGAEAINDVIQQNGGASINQQGILTAAGIMLVTVLIFRRIASNSISMEGSAWWILKGAPISPETLLRGKFAAAFIPFALLSSGLYLGAEIWLRFSPLGFLYGWFGILLLGLVILATATGSSTPWARLDWDDPKKMSSGWGALISITVGGLAALLGGICLCLPVLAEALAPQFTLVAWLLGPLLAVGIIAVVSWFSLVLGAGFLKRVGE